MKTIGFIGLGLIGGSIARAIRKYHEDYHILAYDRDRETLATAVSSNMIDAVCEEQDERFKKCDYIFLCAPGEEEAIRVISRKPPAAIVFIYSWSLSNMLTRFTSAEAMI